jgi:hypothetical protein
MESLISKWMQGIYNGEHQKVRGHQVLLNPGLVDESDILKDPFDGQEKGSLSIE